MIRTNNELLSYIDNLRPKHKSCFTEENYNEKTVIAEQDIRTNWVYVIKEGIAKCSLMSEDGKEFIQDIFGEGMKFGELEVFNKKPIYCSMIAITNVIVYKINHQNFHYLLDTDKKFTSIVIQSLVSKISSKGPRFAFQHHKTIKENIQKLLIDFPDVIDKIPKQDIANYLGINLRSFNRVLNEIS